MLVYRHMCKFHIAPVPLHLPLPAPLGEPSAANPQVAQY